VFRRITAPLAAALVVGLTLTLVPQLPAPVEAAAAATRLVPPAEAVDDDGGPVTRASTAPQNRVRYAPAPAPQWPAAVTTTMDLTSARKSVGSAPVRVAGSGRATVRVLDRASLPPQWRDGLVMSLTAAAGSAAGKATVAVDYSGFRYAVGGQWASRLRLWRMPGCALTSPGDPACRSVPLPSTNDLATGVVTATTEVQPATTTAAKGGYVVLAAAESGADGDFSATPLAPSGAWTSGGNSGDFSWQYPLRTPPATGPAPTLSLSYSAQAVDGRSEITNNQPSWVGEGFEDSPAYVERSYVSCVDDMKKDAAGRAPNNKERTTDQCWRSDNARVRFNGRDNELIYQDGKGWHFRTADGSRIEKLEGADNQARKGEYWKMTTPEGTQYYFGLNKLPGQTAATESTLRVPVAGNHPDEPCHAAGGFKASFCDQAWRWQLDYVVDVRGNTMSYWYGRETNKYARMVTDSDDVSYDRAGYLTRIDYGTYDRTEAVHGVTGRSTTPYAQVVFEAGMRCFSDCGTEAEPKKPNWKDTPWDQACKATATECKNNYAPTFWTAKRLAKVTTRVWDTTKATPAWQDVESWTLGHTFAATADSTHTGLWLDRIDHAGHVGGTETMPPVTFTAVSMANRVLTMNGAAHNWLRISDIVTETGSRIHVDYSQKQCTASNLPAEHANTMRCYPVRVPDPLDPTDERTVTQWWHKYVVEHVAENDLQLGAGQSPAKHTRYAYGGTPAWHYADDDGMTRPNRKTWSQWRGYPTVSTRVGDDPAVRTLTVTHFLRGMHGDRAGPGGGTTTVTVPASLGDETVHDEDQFAGQIREQIVYDGVDTRPVSKSVNVPWRSDPVASRTINGDTVEARFTGGRVAYTAVALGRNGSRGWRVARTITDTDPAHGTVNWTQADGDVAVPGDERCTRYGYLRNPAKNLVNLVARTTVTALACDDEPATVDDVISDERKTFDDAATPRFGSVTRIEKLKDWTTAGTVWQTVTQASYLPDGKQASETDIRGNVTRKTYSPEIGGPVTEVATTGPAPTWTSRQWINPYWGSRTKVVDINGRVSLEATYDALGRIGKVWRMGWPRAGHENQPSQEYQYVFAPDRNAYPYVRTRELNHDGNAVTSYQILDGLLRPRQTQSISLAGDGNRVVTDTIYDQAGRAAAEYGAHVEPGAPSGTLWSEPEWSVPAVSRTDYDRASRVTDVVFLSGDGVSNLVEKWRTTTRNEGDLTRTIPPAGGTATTVLTDIEGRAVALRQHNTAAGIDGGYQETSYTYNRKDQLIAVADADGNQWTYKFDPRGRQIEATDPDAGASISTYTEFGDVQTTTDARKKKLWLGYDAYGRKTQLRDDSETGALRATWRHDTLYSGQPGFLGHLTEAVRFEPAGSGNAYKWQVRQFDNRYQPTGVNHVIPAAEGTLADTYVYEYEFSPATGAPVAMTLPGGKGGLVNERITTDYHGTTGLPVRVDTSLTGAAGTLATTSYTAYGEINGSVYQPPGGSFVEDVVHRDESTRRVTRSTVQTETADGTIADRRYTYDPAGNITAISDTPGVGAADQECFRYDALARLTSAWTPKPGVTCETGPRVADLGGPAPYWQDWTLDATGNRLTEKSHAAGGDTTTTYTVPDGGASVTRPHAVTGSSTATPGALAVTREYTYDAAGNQVCRPDGDAANDCAAGTASQKLTWDAEGKLATVTADGKLVQTNIYDTGGTRLVRRDATGTTLYLPGQELRREGTTITGTRYYNFGGQIGASRTGGSAARDLTWLYSDHQGTQQTAVNAATQAVTVRRQTPYGGPRGSRSPWVNGKGFVGGDVDPIGLTAIGAREYDAGLGRFISVDPMMDLSDPQHLHGYAYSNNSPITLSDPDGLDPGGGQACDTGRCPQKYGDYADPPGSIAQVDRDQEKQRQIREARKKAFLDTFTKKNKYCNYRNTCDRVRALVENDQMSPEMAVIHIMCGDDDECVEDKLSGEDGGNTLDDVQGALTVIGFVPGLGEPADLADAVISIARGNVSDAGWSILAMIPGLGIFAGLKRLVGLGKKADNPPTKLSDQVAAEFKKVDEVVEQLFPGMKRGPAGKLLWGRQDLSYDKMTPEQIKFLRGRGMTRAQAKIIYDAYSKVAKLRPDNPSARQRAELAQYYLKNL
jgi:RHS repeat-associated protein